MARAFLKYQNFRYICVYLQLQGVTVSVDDIEHCISDFGEMVNNTSLQKLAHAIYKDFFLSFKTENFQ